MTVAPMTLTDDRRHKRSGDPLVALHYQLAHVRSEGRLEAIVVADGAGVMVAGAGGWGAARAVGDGAALAGAVGMIAFAGLFLVAAWGCHSSELSEIAGVVRRRLGRAK